MSFTYITDDYAVAPQIQPGEVPDLAQAGFRTLICNRPDGEEPGQPTAQDLADAAQQAGMTFVLIPVAPSGIRPDQAKALADGLADMPRPILAYCRSGNRSAKLYEAAQNYYG